MAVEADGGGFLARSGEAVLRGTLATSTPTLLAATVVEGERDGGRGLHALDYGRVVPAPWARFDGAVTLPFAACWALHGGGAVPGRSPRRGRVEVTPEGRVRPVRGGLPRRRAGLPEGRDPPFGGSRFDGRPAEAGGETVDLG
jgi:hypothetical protein